MSSVHEQRATRVAMLLAKSDEHDTRVRKEAESLASAGYAVRVFSVAAEGRPRQAVEHGVEYERFELQRSFRDAWQRRRARQDERRRRFDLPYRVQVKVETFAYKRANVVARHVELWRAFAPAVAAYAPDVVHAHDLSTLYAGRRYAKAHGVPLVYDAHELEVGSRRNREPYERLIARILERRGARAAVRVITVAPPIADELARLYSIPRPAVVLNSPSLSTRDAQPPFSLRAASGAAHGDVVLVYTGLLLAERGLAQMAAALPLLPSARLVALGPRDPDAEAAFLEQARALGVEDRVHLVDPVPGEYVPATVATADIAVIPLPGHYRSYDLAMPNKLFDAVMAGIPIVTSRITGVGGFVREHALGEVFDLDSPESIAAAVRAVAAQQPAGLAELDALQREVAWERQQAVLRELYASLAVR